MAVYSPLPHDYICHCALIAKRILSFQGCYTPQFGTKDKAVLKIPDCGGCLTSHFPKHKTSFSVILLHEIPLRPARCVRSSVNRRLRNSLGARQATDIRFASRQTQCRHNVSKAKQIARGNVCTCKSLLSAEIDTDLYDSYPHDLVCLRHLVINGF